MSDYALEGPKWTSSTITWSFASAGGLVSNAIDASYQATIRAAVARWAQVSNLTFRETADSSNVNIRVGWGLFGNGQIGETDYSYTVGGTATFVNGVVVRLEDPSAQPVGTSVTSRYQGTSTTLYEVMLHEFGHALGLDHSTDANATMYPYLGPNNGNLDASDIAGITALYGANSSTAQVAAVPVVPTPVTLTSGQVAVYRFFDKNSGAQFLTGSTAERNTLIQTRPDLAYQGLGMAGIDPDGGDANAAPVFRFFDTRNGTHLFTTSTSEVASIKATRSDLVQEQTTFSEHLMQQVGDVAVFRFFNKVDGTHFYTQSATEQATVIASRPDMAYEGVAFYAPATA